MVIICAWCGDYIGKKAPFHIDSKTPGLCVPCLKLHYNEKGEPPPNQQFLQPSNQQQAAFNLN